MAGPGHLSSDHRCRNPADINHLLWSRWPPDQSRTGYPWANAREPTTPEFSWLILSFSANVGRLHFSYQRRARCQATGGQLRIDTGTSRRRPRRRVHRYRKALVETRQNTRFRPVRFSVDEVAGHVQRRTLDVFRADPGFCRRNTPRAGCAGLLPVDGHNRITDPGLSQTRSTMVKVSAPSLGQDFTP
jgi:hypothetical protein